MNPLLNDLTREILTLQPEEAIGSTRACKLCNYPAHHFDVVDFNKSCNMSSLPRTGVGVEYFRCQRCELLFTDFFDTWSPDDFRKYIYNHDYSEVDPEYLEDRPKRAAEELQETLAGAEECRILDYGSGTGVFEKELRARGFSRVKSYDPFSQPQRPEGPFDIVTCFDVIEHSPTPRDTLADIISFLAEGGLALVGQTLQPQDINSQKGEWWYIAPRNGHAVTYSYETLYLYAEAEGLTFDDFGDLFSITRRNQSDITRSIIERRRPQRRRLVLHAPEMAQVEHEAWHEVESAPSGTFRWTRQDEISFGVHMTPRGYFRVVLRHFGRRDEEFLAKSRIRIGGDEQPIQVHEENLYATFHLPCEAMRDVSLKTPVPYSDAAAGRGLELRPVGLAIACWS